MQDEQGQTSKVREKDLQSVTGKSNDRDTHIGGTSVGDMEKKVWKADSVQFIENRQFNET